MRCIFSRHLQSARKSTVDSVGSTNPAGEALSTESTTQIGAEKQVDSTNPTGKASSTQSAGSIRQDNRFPQRGQLKSRRIATFPAAEQRQESALKHIQQKTLEMAKEHVFNTRKSVSEIATNWASNIRSISAGGSRSRWGARRMSIGHR